MGQINLFENYTYSIGPCVLLQPKKKKKKKTALVKIHLKKLKYERSLNVIP